MPRATAANTRSSAELTITMAAAVMFWLISGIIVAYGDGAWKFTAVSTFFLGCVAAVRYYLLSQYFHLKEENSYLDLAELTRGGPLETL